MPAVVLYDDDCAFCRKSVSILKSLDWRKKLEMRNARDESGWPASQVPLVMEKMIEEMHLVTPDGKRAYAGFAAFRWMAWRLPATMLLAPLLYLPGVPWLGNRIYRWVAKNRFKLVPCDNGECRVPLKKPTAVK